MSSIEQQAKGKKDGEIRYLTPLNIDTSKNKKYCRFKKSGIKYIDYKDPDFLLKFVNEQGKLLPRRLTGTSLKYQRKTDYFRVALLNAFENLLVQAVMIGLDPHLLIVFFQE